MIILFRINALCLLLSFVYAPAHAQRAITVTADPGQGLAFGAFFQGVSGGTVIIYPDGSRAVSGSVVQANLGLLFSPAAFEIDADPSTSISIVNGPDVTLNGSNGGSIQLKVGASSLGAQFITTAVPPALTQVLIGGILTIGSPAANPAGNYSGMFSVTFIQE